MIPTIQTDDVTDNGVTEIISNYSLYHYVIISNVNIIDYVYLIPMLTMDHTIPPPYMVRCIAKKKMKLLNAPFGN